MILKNVIERNPVIFFLVVLVTGFSAGFGAHEAIRRTAKLETISKTELALIENEKKGMKTKIADLEKNLQSKEFKESDYKKEIHDLKLQVFNLKNNNKGLNQKIADIAEKSRQSEKALIAKHNSEIENLKRKNRKIENSSKNCTEKLSDLDIRNVQSIASLYLNRLKKNPASAAAFSKKLKNYVDKFGSEPCYEKQVPISVSIIYRLYSAAFLFSPTGSEPSTIEESLIWLRKSMELNKNYADIEELKEAEIFLADIVNEKVQSFALELYFKNCFRIAMIDSSKDEIQAKADLHLIEFNRIRKRMAE